MNMPVQPIEWLRDRVRLLDQTKLPGEEVYLELAHYQDIASAIVELKIRGAPAIGVAGAYALALGALKISSGSKADFLKEFQNVSQAIASTRPTARNLFRSIERMQQVAEASRGVEETKKALVDEAIGLHKEEIEASRRLSQHGAELIKDGFTVLTHCNTGPLAAPSYGTALGVLIYAREQGKNVKVLAGETRPLLQGARLTTWECQKAGLPVTLITDSMAGYFISRSEVDCVILGADRIAANGDTANKIGTYTVAVLAKENGIPFYVAAPTTTVDLSLASGEQISIEQRRREEVTHIQGVPIAPEGVDVSNPAFDVTSNRYITVIITERGIIRPPFGEGLKRIIE